MQLLQFAVRPYACSLRWHYPCQVPRVGAGAPPLSLPLRWRPSRVIAFGLAFAPASSPLCFAARRARRHGPKLIIRWRGRCGLIGFGRSDVAGVYRAPILEVGNRALIASAFNPIVSCNGGNVCEAYVMRDGGSSESHLLIGSYCFLVQGEKRCIGFGATSCLPVIKRCEEAALSTFNTPPVCENLSKFALSRSFFLQFGCWICQPRW